MSEPARTRRIGLFGLGNVLMSDDAVGPWAVRRFTAAWDLPAEVTADDLGTPGLDLHPHLAGLDVLVIVDAVRADAPPGTVKVYRRDEILRHPPAQRVGPHDPGLKEALLTLEFAGGGPREVTLVGVVPTGVSYDVGLSDAMRDAWPRIERALLDELARLGCPARRADPPREPELWWESAAAPSGPAAPLSAAGPVPR